jgi:hypothetical protein
VVPKRDETVIDLVGGKDPDISILQQAWLKDRHAEGRKVGVIIWCKDGGVWLPGLSWNRAYPTSSFRNELSTRQHLAEEIINLTGGPL